MASLISISFADTIGPLLDGAGPKIQNAIQRVVDETAATALQRIINRTPRDSGKAALGWSIKQSGGGSATIENDVPYINVLEHGGYPVQSKKRLKKKPPGSLSRGGAYLGGNYEPGPRTERAGSAEPKMLEGSNISKGAPNGMVRLVLGEIDPEFEFNLEEAIDEALNDL